MTDRNGKTVKIGDIIKIENAPAQSDNALYVVVQDGTSDLYTDKKNLTLYKVNKCGEAFALSKTKYNICFYPLCNTSNRYKFTRQELDAATLELIKESDSGKIQIEKARAEEYEPEQQEQAQFFAELIDKDGTRVEDVSYLCRQAEKLCAFFSNLTLKAGQHIKVSKYNYQWEYRKNIEYKIKGI